jgi:acetyl esterase/lipase
MLAAVVALLRRWLRDLEGALFGMLPPWLCHAIRDSKACHVCLAEAPMLILGSVRAIWKRPGAVLQLLARQAPGTSLGVRYAPDTHCTLDVYGQSSDPKPIVVWVHGGVWSFSRRWYYRLFAEEMASRGICCVVPGYSYYPEGDCFSQAECVGRVLQWVQSWAAQAPVVVVGHSSGAHISALQLFGMYGCKVDGFIGVGGVYDIGEHWLFEKRRGVQEISPMQPACCGLWRDGKWDFSRASLPLLIAAQEEKLGRCERVLLLHGLNDEVVPHSQSQILCSALSGDCDVEVQLLPDEDHTKFIHEVMDQKPSVVLEHIVQFVRNCKFKDG